MQSNFNRYSWFFCHFIELNSRCLKHIAILLLFLFAITAETAQAGGFSANFKDMEIQEFINSVSKDLNKTIIVDPTVIGKINVRSYDELNADQYYQFFLSVMEVYGFSVITMDNGFLKVIPSKNVKGSAIPVATSKAPGAGDEIIIRVVPVHNVLARDMVPLLRQLTGNENIGNVVHYDMSNMLLLTGRAEVVNHMLEIIQDIDKASNQSVIRIALQHASAADVAKTITTLTREDMPGMSRIPNGQSVRVVPDERTNSVLVGGEEKARNRVVDIVRQLDRDTQSSNTKVIFLKYAKASSLVAVLTGSGSDAQNKNNSSPFNQPGGLGGGPGFGGYGNPYGGDPSMGMPPGGSDSGMQGMMMSGMNGGGPSDLPPGFGLGGGSRSNSGSGISLLKNATVKADEDTNSVIVTAPPDVLRDLESVINQLDVRRAQVLVEAVIVEVQDIDGLNLGVQWFNHSGGGTIFPNSDTSIAGTFPSKDNPNPSFAGAAAKGSGLVAGFYHGNWSALFNALESNSKNDVLATPSIVTLDNAVAHFSVGQDVPVLSGQQQATTGDNLFNQVSRRNVGIKLYVKPQINKGNSVMLQIFQEVSSVTDQAPTGTSNLGASFNIRTVDNSVLVSSGETVVIGGILNSDNRDTISKVPLLGDIPFLGTLFRYSKKSDSKRNLMLFIRPVIIRDNETYQQQSVQQYDRFQTNYKDGLNRAAEALPPQLHDLQQQQRARQAYDHVQQNINQFFNSQ